MNEYDPIYLLFGGSGPGSAPARAEHTLAVLRWLPKRRYGTVVDAGSDTGRQTIALARGSARWSTPSIRMGPSSKAAAGRRKRGVGHLVETYVMDMADIPSAFQGMNLLWSEGGRHTASGSRTRSARGPPMKAGGFIVASELTLADPPESA
ncbi:MAG: hypothetical protein R3B51_08740 [Thermodesulfobacteriota bacterium]